MKTKYSIFLAFAALFFSSCGSHQNTGYYLGKTKYYNDFLFSIFNWEEITLPTQSLQFEMEGIEFTKPIKLQVVYLDQNGNYLPVNSSTGQYITIFKGNDSIEGSDILISPKDKNIDLKFRFNPSAKEGTYNIFLKILDSGDLDQINDCEVTKGCFVKNENGDDWQWIVILEKGLSPSEIILIWLGIIIATILVLWFAVVRWIIFPTFAFDNLQVAYMDGDSRKGREDCSLHGARKIICSANPKSQSALSRLFSGRIEYLTNQFWETPVVMTPCGSSGIAVSEELKAGNASTYRMSAMITPQNGPRRPFVIKKTRSDMTANISIG